MLSTSRVDNETVSTGIDHSAEIANTLNEDVLFSDDEFDENLSTCSSNSDEDSSQSEKPKKQCNNLSEKLFLFCILYHISNRAMEFLLKILH